MILANIYIKRLNKNNRYLVYADESGTVGINDSENFVIAAIILHEEKWFEADKLISNLKREFFPRDAPEIHMSEIVNRNNAFKSMDEEKRAEIIFKYSVHPWNDLIIPGLCGKPLNTGIINFTNTERPDFMRVLGFKFDDTKYIFGWLNNILGCKKDV